MLHDTRTGENTLLFESDYYMRINASPDGRVAFSYFYADIEDLYVLNVAFPEEPPFNLSDEFDLPGGYPLCWDPEGRQLAFSSSRFGSENYIYVWDGETVLNITPDDMPGDPDNYEASWSFDGRLAFTAWFGSTGDAPKSEIYLWDGSTTSNLSQNLAAEDRGASWNIDGELAFTSSLGGESRISIWDGVSFKDGLPDSGTFINASSGLDPYTPSPTWTSDGRLAFGASSPQDEHIQIYVWDGQTTTNVSQNPGMHNGGPRWRDDGYWAFVTGFSSEQLLYIRDAENRTILTTEGQYTPAWSSDGRLIFCKYDRPDWVLLMWDDWRTSEFAHRGEIQAQWQSGQDVWCSSG